MDTISTAISGVGEQPSQTHLYIKPTTMKTETVCLGVLKKNMRLKMMRCLTSVRRFTNMFLATKKVKTTCISLCELRLKTTI